MPNKYSHATVLSNYESYGLIGFDRPRSLKPSSSSASSKSTSTSRSRRSTTKPNGQALPSYHHSSKHVPRQRIRLGSPSRIILEPEPDVEPEPEPIPPPPPLHRKTSSIETQIYAPLHSPATSVMRTRGNETLAFTFAEDALETEGAVPDMLDRNDGLTSNSRPSTSLTNHTREGSFSSNSRPSTSHTRHTREGSFSSNSRPSTSHTRHTREGSFSSSHAQKYTKAVSPIPQETNVQDSIPSKSKAGQFDKSSTEIRDFVTQHGPAVRQYANRRHSSPIPSGARSPDSPENTRAAAVHKQNDSHKLRGFGQPLRIPYNRYGRVAFAAQDFAPERPPSPPATPDSAKSFTLETPIEKPDPISLPPPVPERSARRSPPGPSPSSESPSALVTSLKTEPLRSKASTSFKSPQPPKSPKGTTFSISPRTSSLKAATSFPQDLRTLPMPSEPLFDDESESDMSPTTRIATVSPLNVRTLSVPPEASFDDKQRADTAPKTEANIAPPSNLRTLSMPSEPLFDDDVETDTPPKTKNNITPPLYLRTLSMPSRPLFDDDAELDPLPERYDTPSEPFGIDDADLESLPSTYVPSSPDFNVQPWSNENIGPAIFRAGVLNSGRPSFAGSNSGRPSTAETFSPRSSFDSAAPPPIGMNRRVPFVVNEIGPPKTPITARSHRRSRPSLASLAFFRSSPKAILYSETEPGVPPVPVTVSRTAVPSIPALFPGYKGPFPPEANYDRSSRVSRDINRAKQMRGRSVPPKTERRRSWFKADPLEKPFALRSPKDGEQFLKNIHSVGLH